MHLLITLYDEFEVQYRPVNQATQQIKTRFNWQDLNWNFEHKKYHFAATISNVHTRDKINEHRNKNVPITTRDDNLNFRTTPRGPPALLLVVTRRIWDHLPTRDLSSKPHNHNNKTNADTKINAVIRRLI